MLKDNIRICDVCGEEITKGEKFNQQTVSADRAALFLAAVQAIHDYEMQQSWTKHPDGSITVDLCLQCYISIGHGETEKAH